MGSKIRESKGHNPEFLSNIYYFEKQWSSFPWNHRVSYIFLIKFSSNYTKYVKGAYNSGLNTGNRPSTSSNRYESEFTGEYVDRSSSSGAHRSKQIGSSSKTNHYEQVNLDLNPENYERKYRKFVSEISILLDNINLANEMIDNANPNKQVDESLRTILSNLRDLENNLVRAIQNQIKNEKLLGICLGINDDLNRVTNC